MAPHHSEFISRPTAKTIGAVEVLQHHFESGACSRLDLELLTRCRECSACLTYRSRLWQARAKCEIDRAHRSWFGTLTLNVDAHLLMLNKARLRLSYQDTDLDVLDASANFRERMVEIGRELQLWLKRVRKRSGAPLKYLIVAEKHQSGLPHLHCLVHEVSDAQVSYRDLSETWSLGFTKFNLVTDRRAGWYVCKYLSKSLEARVRASQAYGASLDAMSQRNLRSLAARCLKKAYADKAQENRDRDSELFDFESAIIRAFGAPPALRAPRLLRTISDHSSVVVPTERKTDPPT